VHVHSVGTEKDGLTHWEPHTEMPELRPHVALGCGSRTSALTWVRQPRSRA